MSRTSIVRECCMLHVTTWRRLAPLADVAPPSEWFVRWRWVIISLVLRLLRTGSALPFVYFLVYVYLCLYCSWYFFTSRQKCGISCISANNIVSWIGRIQLIRKRNLVLRVISTSALFWRWAQVSLSVLASYWRRKGFSRSLFEPVSTVIFW